MTTFTDGIYFDMPEDIYHAIPRFSCSGAQNVLVSPATFWARSWLNAEKAALLAMTALSTVLPQTSAYYGMGAAIAAELGELHGGRLPKVDSEQLKADTDAAITGRAYHKARLEPDLFESCYVRGLAKGDMPDGTLFTGTDMGAALERMGEKKSGSVAEQAERLVAAGYVGTIWQVELSKWEDARAGRIELSPKVFDQIHDDAERLRLSPEVAAKLEGGVAEVVVLWTCPRTGIPMKCRIDYLTPEWWTDLKTFANINGKHLYQAITDAFQYNRYHVQPVIYRDAVEAIRNGAVQIVGDATDAQRDVVAAIQIRLAELDCWYVFQEKGGIPNILARRIKFFQVPEATQANHAITDDPARIAEVERTARTTTALFDKAARDVTRAKTDFANYSEIYSRPGQPWLTIRPVGDFEDGDFRSFWLDE